MDLRQLQCFMSVAKHHGFRRGAETLRVAQPAVSRHVKRLEAELGHELFHRRSGGAKLTEAGEILYRRSQELFDRISAIQDEFAALTGNLSGLVRVGGASSINEILFAPLADRAHREYPGIQLSVLESGCRLLGLLEEGHLDVAVLSTPWRMEGSRWGSRPLAGERVYIVGTQDVLWSCDPISFRQVLASPLILSPAPNAQRLKLAHEAGKRGCTMQVVAEAESLHGQAALVERGMGFAVLPYSAACLMVRDHSLSMHEIKDFYTWRSMVWRSDRHPSRAQEAIRRLIVEEFERLLRNGCFGPPVTSPQPPSPHPVEQGP